MCGHGDGGEGGGSSAGEKVSGDKKSEIKDFIKKISCIQGNHLGQDGADLPPPWPRSRALPTLASIGQICPPSGQGDFLIYSLIVWWKKLISEFLKQSGALPNP